MALIEDTISSQYVQGFKANLRLAPQQTDMRLVGKVDTDLAYGEPGQMFNADDVGATDPEDIATRVPNTPDKFISETRRIGYFAGFQDAFWVDTADKLRQLSDPTSTFMQSILAGKNRKMDTAIMLAAVGNAYSIASAGAAPTVSALPASQIIAANDVSFKHDSETLPVDGADYNLSVGKIIQAGLLLDDSDLEGTRYWAWSPSQKADLLRRTPATSRFYNDVLALTNGQISTFMGFTFVLIPRSRPATSLPFTIPAAAGGAAGHDGVSAIRQNIAWIEPALLYRARTVETVRIGQRPDKSFRTQAYYETEHGAVRRYDKGVVQINCYEGIPQ